jgi:ABC-2 type transport system ATP-binding protein
MIDARLPLRLTGVTRLFDAEAGVRDVDLDVRAGEVHALVGLNGAGKSTLMKLMLRMLRPDAGRIEVLGADVRQAPAAVWARVGAVIEYPLAYGELTGRTNLELTARLRGVDRPAVSGMVEDVLDELDLRRYAGTRARRLSLGNRQRLGLAGALLHRPDLIILDEPTNALDPAGVILLREALSRRAAIGAAVLVSSHHLDEVARLATRISVIADGRLIGSLDPQGIDIERSFFALVHEASASAATGEPR